MPCLIQYCQFHEQQNQKRSVIKQFAAEYKVVRYWGIGVSEMKQNFRIQNKNLCFWKLLVWRKKKEKHRRTKGKCRKVRSDSRLYQIKCFIMEFRICIW